VQPWKDAKAYFEEQLKLTPLDAEGIRGVERASQRLREQLSPLVAESLTQDLPGRSLDLDVADFTARVTTQQSPGKVRGLFATEDIRVGDVVMSEKASSTDWAHESRSWCATKYDARKGDGVSIGFPELWKSVVGLLLKGERG
jgi:hypothetical protein